MKNAGTLRMTTPTDTAIVLTRVFDAPRLLVFDAWTKPELLMRWYGARGWILVGCEVDLRIGGCWRFVSRGPDGTQMAQGGVYREIVPSDRLVYTESFDEQSYPGESLITHVFVEQRGKTTTTSTLVYPSPEARDIVINYPMKRGVGEGYDRLAVLLAEMTSH